MPIIIERPTKGRRDPFDRLAVTLRRLPLSQRLEQSLIRHPTVKRWAWFAMIYLVSVVVFAAVAFFLNAIVPK